MSGMKSETPVVDSIGRFAARVSSASIHMREVFDDGNGGTSTMDMLICSLQGALSAFKSELKDASDDERGSDKPDADL